MDDADRASLEEERSLAEALRAARRTAGPEPTGRCHWCEEIVNDTARWCGPDCREDWDRDVLRKRNIGLT